ncbi:MAG: SH3 domain-containing protein [Clostridia bacterium]|nr:SH3 domain-containing protein [Clostridia bacterium]
MNRKSIFPLLLALCLAFSALMMPAAFAAHTEYVKNPTGRTVNIRSGPSKDNVVKVELKPGTKVTVESINGTWSHISSPVDGWIMSRYLTDNPGSSAPGGTVPSTMTRYIVSPNGGKINVRHGPSATGYAVAAQLDEGTEVQLLSTLKNGWAAIEYNGFKVYVMTKYLSRVKPGTTWNPKAFKAFAGQIYSPNGKQVNFRVKADLKADRIAQLDPWTNVEVIGQSGDWYKVKWAAATGYIMKKYVRQQ